MAEKKLIDLELLKRYHGKSLAQIKELMKEAEEVAVSNTAPTNSGAKIWVNTAATTEVVIPEINDGATSDTDTWSSLKIVKVIDNTIETTINDNLITTDDIDAMFAEA